ncbi:GNAT family N-acetyltransferase [Mesorhizobium sp. Cs1321R2N1]|uniref:GNAT family N-acetyltransferase n=1 Tax=Mesorhizobium sp. Cs1321R2N1 TaxID=3015174 RepID=UPI00301D0CF8
MQPTIEPMREHDIDVVARLRIAAFFEGTGRTLEEDAAGLRNLLTSDGFETALVARVNDVPVGTCLLVHHELEPAHDVTPWLAGLVVDAAHQGKGTGTALVKAIEAHAASVGVEMLYLYTWQAREFYAALGWETVEVCEQGGETMMLMSRRLDHSFPTR